MMAIVPTTLRLYDPFPFSITDLRLSLSLSLTNTCPRPFLSPHYLSTILSLSTALIYDIAFLPNIHLRPCCSPCHPATTLSLSQHPSTTLSLSLETIYNPITLPSIHLHKEYKRIQRNANNIICDSGRDQKH